jgi:hypothetical protein
MCAASVEDQLPAEKDPFQGPFSVSFHLNSVLFLKNKNSFLYQFLNGNVLIAQKLTNLDIKQTNFSVLFLLPSHSFNAIFSLVYNLL